MKKQVCKLNEKWDKLYEITKLKEKASKNILASWYTYKEKKAKITEWLRNHEIKLRIDISRNMDDLREKEVLLEVSKKSFQLVH